MENIVGQPNNQLVCNRAYSLEGGQYVWKIQKRHQIDDGPLCPQFPFTIDSREAWTRVTRS